MGIDDIADKRTRNLKSPGERFEERFLSKRAHTQWPVYLNQTAVEIEDKILQGDTGIDKANFAPELGPRYRRGMEAATGDGADLGTILDETISASDLGTIVYQLNRLSYEIEGDDSGLKNVQEALEAVFEKLLTSETGYDLSAQGRTDTGTITDIVIEMFSDERIANEAKTLVDEFEASLSEGLLAKLDEPQMMTPLWEHQFEALEEWQDAGYRGYADMATATGKTVLGIAAIALRYGYLHPLDELFGARQTDGRDDVLVVAHNDLIIEQWRREFDRHLNIPRQRTGSANDIELSWGRIHFRTPQALLQQDAYSYDLVILDEAHHYANGNEWGQLLDEFDCDILALSGSVDDAGVDSEALKRRLRTKVGPELARYTITDAQRDGVIPAFDWEVRYAPYDSDDEFVSVTQDIEEAYPEFEAAVERGDVDTDWPLRTYDEIRTFAHTTEGKEYKRENEVFRDLSTALFSRRTRRWNLSPVLNAVVDIVEEHRNDHVVVLADSNAQVEKISEMLSERYPSVDRFVVTRNQDRSDLRDTIDEFDTSEEGGVLVGTGDLLGEGVDIPNARVAINMATGGVNPELVQRIGRVLRNPSGDKHAQFYNVVGVPEGEASVPREDGRRLLTDAARFCSLGDKFENLPAFATSEQINDEALGDFLQQGAKELDQLAADEGDHEALRPDTAGRDRFLWELRDLVPNSGACSAATVLAQWAEYSWLETAGVRVPGTEQADVQEQGPTVDDSDADRPEEAETTEASEEDELPSRVQLTQALRRLDNETSGALTREVVREAGEYAPEIYDRAFGSWGEALRASGFDIGDEGDAERRAQVVEWLQAIAVETGREPTPGDLYQYDATPTEVYNAFESWDDAIDAAGVEGGPTEDLVDAITTSAEEGEETETAAEESTKTATELPEANELVELCDSFSQLATLLESLVAATEVEDESPLAIWHRIVAAWYSGRGPSGAPSYSHQQSERGPANITAYREVYGDGEAVTDFSVIDTGKVTEAERRLLLDADIVEGDREFHLPVAPESESRLPIAVVDEGDLGQALLLLSEFPRHPTSGSGGARVAEGDPVNAARESNDQNDESDALLKRLNDAYHLTGTEVSEPASATSDRESSGEESAEDEETESSWSLLDRIRGASRD